jgi:hypothetical protein
MMTQEPMRLSKISSLMSCRSIGQQQNDLLTKYSK